MAVYRIIFDDITFHTNIGHIYRDAKNTEEAEEKGAAFLNDLGTTGEICIKEVKRITK